MPDLSHLLADSETSSPALVRNGNFEFKNLHLDSYPAEWEPYTGDREPWGTVHLLSGGGVELSHNKRKGWGCMIQQAMMPETFETLKGKEVEVTLLAQGSAKDVLAAVYVDPEDKQHVRLVKTGDEGDWQRFKAIFRIPAAAQQFSMNLGALNGNTVRLKNLEINVSIP